MKDKNIATRYRPQDEGALFRTGEFQLLCATLERGLVDFLGIACPPSDRLDAIDWLLDDNQEPFSFVWICENLEISFLSLRDRMIKLVNLPLDIVAEQSRYCRTWMLKKYVKKESKKARAHPGRRGITSLRLSQEFLLANGGVH